MILGADVTAMAAKRDDIFAANRAVGRVALSVKSVAGKTRRAHVDESGSLRVRCPGAPAEELEAILINTAGGIAGGRKLPFDLKLRKGDRTATLLRAAARVPLIRLTKKGVVVSGLPAKAGILEITLHEVRLESGGGIFSSGSVEVMRFQSSLLSGAPG